MRHRKRRVFSLRANGNNLIKNIFRHIFVMLTILVGSFINFIIVVSIFRF